LTRLQRDRAVQAISDQVQVLLAAAQSYERLAVKAPEPTRSRHMSYADDARNEADALTAALEVLTELTV
jgi:hypothetical protein